jgi:hypothetical protein
MYILSTGCDVCGIKNKAVWAKEAAQKKTLWSVYIGLWLPTYCLLKWLMKMKKTKTADYACLNTIHASILYIGTPYSYFGIVIRCRSSVDRLVCVHLLLF